MPFHLDTWPGKIGVVLALVGLRELVRLLSPKPVAGQPAAGEDNARWLIETLDSAAIAIGLVLFVIQPFLLQAFYIPSGSMEDTLLIKDRLLVSKLVYRLRDPRFQDVVVFRAPEAVTSVCGASETQGEAETDFIKRCIGTPGDVVYARNGRYYHNRALIDEPYVKWDTSDGSLFYDMKIVGGTVFSRASRNGRWQASPLQLSDVEQQRVENASWEDSRVPPARFLMLGDHRSNSCDSHMWGFVPRENIVGKAVCVFWPPTRLGLLEHMSFRNRNTAPATP